MVPEGDGPVALAISVRLVGDPTGVYVARLEVRDRHGEAVFTAERPFAVGPGG